MLACLSLSCETLKTNETFKPSPSFSAPHATEWSDRNLNHISRRCEVCFSPTPLAPFGVVDTVDIIRCDALVERRLETIEVVDPAVNGGLVVLALKGGAVVGPVGPEGPGAELLVGAFEVSGQDGSVEGGGDNTVLNPINHNSKVGLREGAVGHVGVGSAVSSTGNEVQTVPVVNGSSALVEGHVGVHDTADGLVETDGGSSGDRGVGFTVEVENLSTSGMEVGEIGPAGVEGILVALPSLNHPGLQSVICNAVKVGEVVRVDKVQETLGKLGSKAADAQFIGASCGVVRGLGVLERSTRLVGKVNALAVGVVETINDLLSDSNTLGSDGTVLGRGGTAGRNLSLELEGCATAGGTVVRGSNGSVEVEVQLAKV